MKPASPSALALILLLAAAPSARACVLKITSAEAEPRAGTKDRITVQFIQTHRNCGVDADETQIKTQGLTVLAAPEWNEIRPGVHEAVLDVEYPAAGDASVTAERRCAKGGGVKKYEITVK